MSESEIKNSRLKIVVGYLIIAFSAVLLLSLFSFVSDDSSLFTSNPNPHPDNIAGVFGAVISSYVVLFYGRIAGYLLTFGMFVIGINFIIESKLGRIMIRVTLFFISSICLSILMGLILSDSSYLEAGVIGTNIASSLTQFIPAFILAPFFLFLFILSFSGTMKLFRFMTIWLARAIGTVVLAPFQLFGLVKSKKPSGDEMLASDELPSELSFAGDSGDDMELKPPSYDSFFQTRKEPEYLKPETASNGENERYNWEQNLEIEGAPAFLTDSREKEKLMESIARRYDSFLFDKKTVEVEGKNEPGTLSEVVETPIPPRETLDELAKEVESIPNVEPFDEEISEEKENDLESVDDIEADAIEPAEPEDEIVGEADYSEVKKTRETVVTPAMTDIDSDERNEYYFPDTQLLDLNFDNITSQDEENEVRKVGEQIENAFRSFKIDIDVSGYSRGPAITRYEMIPPTGLKLRNIVNLTDDLALNLGNRNIRIVAPIGNKSIIGVEVPNQHRRNVVLREMIESAEFKDCKARLPLILGKDITGNTIVEDLAEMPHLLIAGTTGSGKSVYVNSLIAGLMFKLTKNDLKFIMIDPKMVELELYNGIPHLLAPVITQPEEALMALEWAIEEMDKRYKLLSDFSVRYIVDYNREAKKINKTREKNGEMPIEELPYIVIVIDEFANLMLRSPKDTEKAITRLAAMARAVGIHLVIATQRPSVDVVTGIIKANFPSRIAFRVSSRTDSRTILDKNGAEKLLGRGDMLFMSPSFTDMLRIQSPFVSNHDVENVVRELKRNGQPEYTIDFEAMVAQTSEAVESSLFVDATNDPLFPDTLRLAVENGEISASFIQRKFRVGYNRASRLIEEMDKRGILAQSTGSSKPRQVLIKQEDLVHYI